MHTDIIWKIITYASALLKCNILDRTKHYQYSNLKFLGFTTKDGQGGCECLATIERLINYIYIYQYFLQIIQNMVCHRHL